MGMELRNQLQWDEEESLQTWWFCFSLPLACLGPLSRQGASCMIETISRTLGDIQTVTLSLLWTWVRTCRVSREGRKGAFGSEEVVCPLLVLRLNGGHSTYRTFYLQHFGQKQILCTKDDCYFYGHFLLLIIPGIFIQNPYFWLFESSMTVETMPASFIATCLALSTGHGRGMVVELWNDQWITSFVCVHQHL